MTYDQNALRWTSADVLSDVRRKASLPATSTDFTDAVLLREATDVLWSFAGWATTQAGEGRGQAILERLVSGGITTSYRTASEFTMPALAVGDIIENIVWLDSTGQNQARLIRVDQADESNYDRPGATGSPMGYSLVAGRVRIYPQPTSGGTIRISYPRRHPELIADTTATVSTIDSYIGQTAQTTFTVSGAWWPANGDEVDIIASNSPYRTIAASVTSTGSTSSTFVLAIPGAQLANLPVVGARVTRAGQSPYVSFPLELRAAVTEKIAANVLRIIGDLQGSQAAEQAAMMELSRVMQLLSPRVRRDKPKAINAFSHMRSLIGRWR